MPPNGAPTSLNSLEVVDQASESTEDVDRTKQQHFRTDHLMGDLTRRAVRGGAFTVGAEGIKFGLQMGATMVLARLLSPADYGLVAMVFVFTGLINLFKDLGLATATIQRAEITHAQVSTLFWINTALGLLLMFLGAALAPVVAWFYDEPRLVRIMLVVSATFGIGGLAAQHNALLRRQMRYYALAWIQVASLAAGILGAFLVVWAGGGYWALVVMPTATTLFATIMAWLLSGWRPGRPRRGSGVSSMIKFGGNLTIFNLTNFFGRNADNALIGWMWGPGPLGLYSRAYSLLMLPMNQINAPLAGVVIPSMSRLQGDPERYCHYYCRIANLVNYGSLPVLALLAAFSNEVISIVLGRQWIEAGAIFSVLAIACIGQPLLWTSSWVHISLGRAYRQRNWGLITDPMFVASFAIGLPWGPMGVAISYAVCVNLVVIPGMLYAFHESPVRMRDLLAAVWCPFLFSGSIFGGAVLGRGLASPDWTDWARIAYGLTGALVAGLVYAGVVRQFRVELSALARLVKHLKKPSN